MSKTDEIAARLRDSPADEGRYTLRTVRSVDLRAILDERDRLRAALESFADALHTVTLDDICRARAALEGKP